MTAKPTIKMYPGTTFNYYIPDDLVAAAEKDADDNVTLDKTVVPLYQIEVLSHEKWCRLQDELDEIEQCHERSDAGDRSQIKVASQLQRQIVERHVKNCSNFPGGTFAPDKAGQQLSARQIAHLTKGINAQRSNEDIDLTVKKKLDSPSGSLTEDVAADPENAPDTETAKTDRQS